ncbi:hypothetical protein ASC61_00705 [Aeromicrobium sp. Root344]|uniref:hypothetical protein n=1 Tax=Aeromicrobium sp. Root344 TaxID=1736521 RepID=UPI0006F68BD7|nr:hypothetical protein [Aeromicrobium sp. Root344]KQV73655.1 hypothetical protein ASC61_00705 [Aeromicrobium sp. Root344]
MPHARQSVRVIPLLAALLVLTGCGSGSSSDEYVSPTHRPAAPPAPQNEKEAVKAAAAAVQRSIDADMAAYTTGDTSSLEDFRTGVSLKNSIAAIKGFADKKYQVSGKVTFELKDGTAESSAWSGTETPFGEAHLTGCVDYTDFVVKDAKGKPVPFRGLMRSLMQQNALWDRVSQSWLVSEGSALGKEC